MLVPHRDGSMDHRNYPFVASSHPVTRIAQAAANGAPCAALSWGVCCGGRTHRAREHAPRAGDVSGALIVLERAIQIGSDTRRRQAKPKEVIPRRRCTQLWWEVSWKREGSGKAEELTPVASSFKRPAAKPLATVASQHLLSRLSFESIDGGCAGI